MEKSIDVVVGKVCLPAIASYVRGSTQFVKNTQVVAPGDRVVLLPDEGEIRVSSGLHASGQYLVASKPGVCRKTNTGTLWIEGREKR